MRMRRAVLFVVVALMMPLASFGAGDPQPIETNGCDICTRDPIDNEIRCEPNSFPQYGDPGFSDCVGGVVCYSWASGERECYPNCGRNACSWA